MSKTTSLIPRWRIEKYGRPAQESNVVINQSRQMSYSLDEIIEGIEYGRILKTDISAGHIILSETIGDLDDIDNGATYSKVLTADFSGSHILLSSTVQSASYRTTTDTEKGTWNGKVITFAQDSIPTSLAIGDLWMDTDDYNSIYRAAIVGANEIIAGEWELQAKGLKETLVE